MTFARMKRVYVAPTPGDAQFVKAFLESAGIAASVRGEHLFALRGTVPMADETLPSVRIDDEDDLEQSPKLLVQLEARARFRPVNGDDVDDDAAAEEWDEGEERIG